MERENESIQRKQHRLMPSLHRFRRHKQTVRYIRLPMHKLAERIVCIFSQELQDIETLVFQMLQHLPNYECAMCTDHTDNRKPFVPEKPYFTTSHNHKKLVFITFLVLLLPQHRSLLAIFQITLKNPSTYVRLSIRSNSNLLLSCQVSHGHHNFPQSMRFLGKYLKIMQAPK